jgi:succinate-acetate transporter protein
MSLVGSVSLEMSAVGAEDAPRSEPQAKAVDAHVETKGRFADPTPLGLIGLAMACASLLPIAFGAKVGVSGLITAAVFCALFGGGCQLVSGLLNLANGNLLGGTLFSAFAFNWALNAWVLWSIAHGVVPHQETLLATEAASLVLFVPLTYAFGHHSALLFAFLLDIDVIYALKLLAGYAHVGGTEMPIAVATLVLGAIAIWLALAMLVNPVAGKRIFPVPGPIFHAR